MNRFPPLMSLLGILLLAGVAAAQQSVSAPATPAKADTTVTVQGAPSTKPDPLLDPAPLPQGKVTLIGGVVRKIDRVRNKLTVEPYGGGRMKMVFDDRTHIYRDDVETTQLGIHKGDRVYVDTMEDGDGVFARNIRVVTHSGPADANGQISSYDRTTGTMVVRDRLSAAPISFRVTSETTIRHEEKAGSLADLQPGALVTIKFSPSAANRGVAQEINVLAVPGTVFTLAGRVTFLDLRRGILALDNRTDGKNYEVMFDRGQISPNLVIGSDVSIQAMFQPDGYRAQRIDLEATQAEQSK